MQKHSVLRPLGSPELALFHAQRPRTALLSVRVPSTLHIGLLPLFPILLPHLLPLFFGNAAHIQLK